MNGLAGRIRWANIARIGGVLIAVGLVVAWPRLKAKPPSLPPATTIPQIQPADPLTPATTETVPPATTVPVKPERSPAPKSDRRKRPKAERKRAKAPPPRTVRPVPVAPSKPQPRPEFEPFG